MKIGRSLISYRSLHVGKLRITNKMNRCSKPSAVYSTIDYSKLHETAIVLHTDVLAASIAASYC